MKRIPHTARLLFSLSIRVCSFRRSHTPVGQWSMSSYSFQDIEERPLVPCVKSLLLLPLAAALFVATAEEKAASYRRGLLLSSDVSPPPKCERDAPGSVTALIRSRTKSIGERNGGAALSSRQRPEGRRLSIDKHKQHSNPLPAE